MKKSEFSTCMSSKAMKTIKAIIAAESLNVKIAVEESALGDTLIVASGLTSEIKTLRSIFNMVA